MIGDVDAEYGGEVAGELGAQASGVQLVSGVG